MVQADRIGSLGADLASVPVVAEKYRWVVVGVVGVVGGIIWRVEIQTFRGCLEKHGFAQRGAGFLLGSVGLPQGSDSADIVHYKPH